MRIGELEDRLRDGTDLRGKELRKRAREIYELEEFEREYEDYGQTFFSHGTSHYDDEGDDNGGGIGPFGGRL